VNKKYCKVIFDQPKIVFQKQKGQCWFCRIRQSFPMNATNQKK